VIGVSEEGFFKNLFRETEQNPEILKRVSPIENHLIIIHIVKYFLHSSTKFKYRREGNIFQVFKKLGYEI